MEKELKCFAIKWRPYSDCHISFDLPKEKRQKLKKNQKAECANFTDVVVDSMSKLPKKWIFVKRFFQKLRRKANFM
ncbi:MAG: hypothetical protein GXO74_09800 [Calditrichaeota bacterium]|nr:hypothetical protein [Calditrichota bacterium]